MQFDIYRYDLSTPRSESKTAYTQISLSSRLTSGHSQAMDSAIGEHLLIINSCRISYEDYCFSVLHRGGSYFYKSPLSM